MKAKVVYFDGSTEYNVYLNSVEVVWNKQKNFTGQLPMHSPRFTKQPIRHGFDTLDIKDAFQVTGEVTSDSESSATYAHDAVDTIRQMFNSGYPCALKLTNNAEDTHVIPSTESSYLENGTDGSLDVAYDTFTSTSASFKTMGVTSGDYINLIGTATGGSDEWKKVETVTDEDNLELLSASDGNKTSSIEYYCSPCAYPHKLKVKVTPTDEDIPSEINVTMSFLRMTLMGQ